MMLSHNPLGYNRGADHKRPDDDVSPTQVVVQETYPVGGVLIDMVVEAEQQRG